MITLLEFTRYAASVDSRNVERLTWLLEKLNSALQANDFAEARHQVDLGSRSGVFTPGETRSLRARISKAEKTFNG